MADTMIADERAIANDVKGLMSSFLSMSDRFVASGDKQLMGEAMRISKIVDRVLEICDGALESHHSIERQFDIKNVVALIGQVDDVITSGRSHKQHAYELQFQFEGDLDFRCSEALLFRVLFNLIKNAANALDRHPKGRIDVFATQTEDAVKFHVADNGPGVPPEIRSLLASDAARWKCACASVGVGLRATQGLLSKIGGDLRLIHSASCGSRFGFSIPLSRSCTQMRLNPATFQSDRTKVFNTHFNREQDCFEELS